MNERTKASICAIAAARRGQLRFRLGLAAFIAVAFHPMAGALPAAAWLVAYAGLQGLERLVLRGSWDDPETVRPRRAAGAVLMIAASNATLCAFGLLEAAHSGVWGLLCGALLWSGAIMYGAIMGAASRCALTVSVTPPALCFLSAPFVAAATGAPLLYGFAVALAGLLNLLSTRTVAALAQSLAASQARERDLRRTLETDAETQLPNRFALEKSLADDMSSVHGVYVGRQAPAQVIFALRIDRYGHLAGALGFDMAAELIRACARRLRASGRADHVAVLATGALGVVKRCSSDSHAYAHAENLAAVFEAPVRIGDTDIDVAVTIGMARADDGATAVQHAMAATEQAGAAGVTACFFDAVAYGNPVENLALMTEMELGVAAGDVSMLYQPKLNLRTGAIAAAEALCRWNHPERGAISPETFVPMAEETGAIAKLTKWTLRRAIRDQRILRQAGCDLAIAVNMSAVLVSDEVFAREAADIVKDADAAISFEITESAVIRNPERAMGVIEMWSRAGISVLVDDYGTGQSSLAYLRSIAADELKIDKTFVTTLADSLTDNLLVRSTIDLAHSLGMKVTAEGVETAEALATLALMGCDWAQGYHISPPLRLAELARFVERYDGSAVPPARATLALVVSRDEAPRSETS